MDVDDQFVWGVNSGDAIYYRPVDGSGGWTRVEGKLIHVSASGNGYNYLGCESCKPNIQVQETMYILEGGYW